jgi:hypothetical protein
MYNREDMNSSEFGMNNYELSRQVAYLVKIKYGTVTEDSLRVIKTPPPIMSRCSNPMSLTVPPGMSHRSFVSCSQTRQTYERSRCVRGAGVL